MTISSYYFPFFSLESISIEKKRRSRRKMGLKGGEESGIEGKIIYYFLKKKKKKEIGKRKEKKREIKGNKKENKKRNKKSNRSTIRPVSLWSTAHAWAQKEFGLMHPNNVGHEDRWVPGSGITYVQYHTCIVHTWSSNFYLIRSRFFQVAFWMQGDDWSIP